MGNGNPRSAGDRKPADLGSSNKVESISASKYMMNEGDLEVDDVHDKELPSPSGFVSIESKRNSKPVPKIASIDEDGVARSDVSAEGNILFLRFYF
jgi:hypothetical protein